MLQGAINTSGRTDLVRKGFGGGILTKKMSQPLRKDMKQCEKNLRYHRFNGPINTVFENYPNISLEVNFGGQKVLPESAENAKMKHLQSVNMIPFGAVSTHCVIK